MSFIFFLLMVINLQSLVAGRIVIDQPGQYALGSNISFAGDTDPDSIILINANDVYLDLKHYSISSSGSLSVNGIEIAAGISNVTIENGMIKSTALGSGIFINQSCSNVNIQNIKILSTDIGITFSSIAGNGISNCLVENFYIENASAQAILLGPSCTNITIRNGAIDNAAVGSSTFAILANGTVANRNYAVVIDNVVITRCYDGIQLAHTDDCLITNCRVLDSTDQSGASAILLTGASGNPITGAIVQNCIVAHDAINAGVSIEQGNYCMIRDCTFEATLALSGFAYSNVNNSILDNCAIPRMVGGSNLQGAFHLNDTTNVLVRNCDALETGTLTAITFLNNMGTGGSFEECTALNSGQIQFYTVGNSNVVLKKCIASFATSTTGSNTGFFINSVNVVADSCIAQGMGTAGATNSSCFATTQGGNNSMFINCIGTQGGDAGSFLIDSPNVAVERCIAFNSGRGFQQGASFSSNDIFSDNIAMLNTGVGFAIPGGSLNSCRYASNAAISNTGGNYSGLVPVQLSQGSQQRAGSNLSI